MKTIVCSALMLFGVLYATSWTPSQTIPPGSLTQISSEVTLMYDSRQGIMVAVWGDCATLQPFVSYYSDTLGTWSTPTSISTSLVFDNVQLSFNPSNGSILATWTDGNTSLPYFAFYNGVDWSNQGFISHQNEVINDVYTVFDPINGLIIATWSDKNLPFYPYVSYYQNGVWSVTPQIISTQAVNKDVTLAFDTTLNKVFAAWGTNATPSYATYNGTSWIAGQIPGMEAANNVNLAYDVTTHQMIAGWVENQTPVVSIFSDSTKTWLTNPIELSAPDTAYVDVKLGFANSQNQIFAAWSSPYPLQPLYSLYNGTTWTPGVISTTGSIKNVCLAFDSGLCLMFAAWQDDNSLPNYSTYLACSLGPVQFLKGFQKINSFGTISELYNTLTWLPPTVFDNSQIIGYEIFRNGIFLDALPPTQLKYQDHNRINKMRYTYEVVAFTSTGESSATIVVP